MTTFDAAKAVFAQVDTNHDGSIDENEFRNWVFNTEGQSSSSNESSISGFVFQDDTTSRVDTNEYKTISSQNIFGSTANLSTSYGVVPNERTYNTSSEQQTNNHSSALFDRIYKDPNPQIIRRGAAGGPLTYQQKVFVRFLQPPPPPPPGPLIIKEVRSPQPAPPPPLRIRQKADPLPQPPPLILRERPPQPPPPIAPQTIIRNLPAVPVPPRSIIIERIPPLPPKPRDIIIERWLPYEPQPKRRTIIQRAPPAVKYPQPRNIVIVYEPIQARIVRQFQKLGINQENPQTYINRYGTSLLDSASLIKLARNAGVIEDLSPPTLASSASVASFGNHAGFGQSTRTISSGGFSLSSASNFEGIQPSASLSAVDHGNVISSSSKNYFSGNGLATSATFSGVNTNYNEQ